MNNVGTNLCFVYLYIYIYIICIAKDLIYPLYIYIYTHSLYKMKFNNNNNDKSLVGMACQRSVARLGKKRFTSLPSRARTKVICLYLYIWIQRAPVNHGESSIQSQQCRVRSRCNYDSESRHKKLFSIFFRRRHHLFHFNLPF